MSIKTLRKRIALVAVSALGVGLLSVAPASAAVPAASTLFVASTASSTGAAVNAANDQAALKSVGWISKTSTNGTAADNGFTLASGLGATGVVYPGAKIAFAGTNAAAANSDISFVVTGGTISGVVEAGANYTISLSGTATVLVGVGDGDGTAEDLGGVFNITAPAGSTATISAYVGTGIAGLTTATNAALIATWTFTVASSSAAGAFSAGDSTINTQAHVAKGTVASGTNAYDTTTRGNNGTVGLIYVVLLDAYGSAITTGNTLAASASNGSTLKIADAASDTGAEAYAATSAYDTATPAAANYVYVNQPTAGVAGETTVTLTLNGANIATKTIKWAGDIAKITVLSSSAKTFMSGVTADQDGTCNSAPSLAGSAANIVYSVTDAAGNAVTMSTQPTIDSGTGGLLGASAAVGTSATAANGCLYQSASLGYGYTTMVVPDQALYGASSYRLKVLNGSGVAVYSEVQNATVSRGATNKFEASWDKATYNPGELATLTIKITDAYGNIMASGTPLTGLALSVASGFTAVGTACAATSLVDSTGTVSCKYAAGNTEGAYSFSIDLDTATTQSPTVGAINVKSATTAVTNAEVLASIVKLIASINKQIRALQKALRR